MTGPYSVHHKEGGLRLRSFGSHDAAALRLICFPHAGGGVATFRDWQQHLPRSIDACTVELPGRDRLIKEPAIESLPRLLDRVARTVEECLDRPYALFGHSMGALLAFELARRFKRKGKPAPAILFVAAHRAPHYRDSRRPLHRLPDAEFVLELQKLQGTHPEVLKNPDLMSVYLPILRADFTLSESYRFIPDEPLSCPISAFGGEKDTEVSEEDIAGWSDQTSAPFKARMMPGDHFFIRSGLTSLLQMIALDLAAVTAPD